MEDIIRRRNGNTTKNAMLIDLIKAGLKNTKDSKPQK
jgi:hypothetical protein